jgi:ABC-type uncharacterized transport system permease subunit
MGRRPAVLKVYRGAHEVISTIMMNYVANGVLLYLLSGALKDPGQRGAIAQQQTPQVEPTAQVGSMVPFFNSIGFDFRGSAPVTWFFVLALVGALVYALTCGAPASASSCRCSAPTPGRPSRPASAATP